MKFLSIQRVIPLLLLCMWSYTMYGQVRENRDPKKDPSLGLLVNAELAANLESELGADQLKGRISMHLKMDPESMKKGYVEVGGLNLAFFGVNQHQIVKGAELVDSLGFFGMSVDQRKLQTLKLNDKRNRLEGNITMYIDASAFSTTLVTERNQNGEKYNDLYFTPTVPAKLYISIDLEEPINETIKEVNLSRAKINISIEADGRRISNLNIASMKLEMAVITQYELLPLAWFEIGKSLCIQPVNIMRVRFFPLSIDITGEGMAFGEPQLRHEWRKNDVVFNIRNPMTIFRNQYYEFEESEAAGLLATVDEDDCIEVFFPHEFDPNDQWGGGACFGSGTATAKVISSDENARMGIDFTHLAHEFGHVLGILHPWNSPRPEAVPGNTGTLMCGSGFANDNPQINSEEHESMISNPLLRFVFMPLSSVTPDCTNDADCGACP